MRCKAFSRMPRGLLLGWSLSLAGLFVSAAYGQTPTTVLDLPSTSRTADGKIAYERLPKLSGEHAIVSRVERNESGADKASPLPTDMRFELHNYLAYFGGRFWCIWSDGPKIEDWPTQEIHYATSRNGLQWSPAKSLTGTPKAPYAYIARGLWIRNGELLALAAHYKGKGAFGADKELQLQAFVWDEDAASWKFKGPLYDNAINNFPPQRLPSGEWIVTRRDSRFNVTVLIGGVKQLDDWQAFPVVRIGEVKRFRPDEPIFWPLNDESLFALYRDNGGSQRLFHSESRDNGRTWTTPVMSNFPNATSKLYSTQLPSGLRVLFLNANPTAGRREMHLALSRDGRRFGQLVRLAIPSSPKHAAIDTPGMRNRFRTGVSSLQYPHAIVQGDHLYLAFSRNKLQTEILKIPIAEVEKLAAGAKAP